MLHDIVCMRRLIRRSGKQDRFIHSCKNTRPCVPQHTGNMHRNIHARPFQLRSGNQLHAQNGSTPIPNRTHAHKAQEQCKLLPFCARDIQRNHIESDLFGVAPLFCKVSRYKRFRSVRTARIRIHGGDPVNLHTV